MDYTNIIEKLTEIFLSSLVLERNSNVANTGTPLLCTALCVQEIMCHRYRLETHTPAIL